MSSTESIRIQRLLALLTLGVCDALQNDVMSIDEAEHLLFSPHSMRCCEEIGASVIVTGIIHEGTELDSIKRLLSVQKCKASISKMMQDARTFLRNTEPSEPQLEKWIDRIIFPCGMKHEGRN